jgi:hypothetical protein
MKYSYLKRNLSGFLLLVYRTISTSENIKVSPMGSQTIKHFVEVSLKELNILVNLD